MCLVDEADAFSEAESMALLASTVASLLTVVEVGSLLPLLSGRLLENTENTVMIWHRILIATVFIILDLVMPDKPVFTICRLKGMSEIKPR